MSALLLSPVLTSRAQAQAAARTLRGKITLQGWLGSYAPARPQNYTFVLADQTSPTYRVQQVPYALDGSFTLSVPAGNYKIGVKADRFLRNVGTADLTNADVNNFALTLLTGDVDGSNAVNVDDLTLLLNSFNSVHGDGTYERSPKADLNGNGSIDVDDLTLLLNNYNGTGMPPPLQSIGLSSIRLSSYAPTGPTTITGTLYLSSPAPAGGVDIRLDSSNNSLVNVLQMLHIVENATQGNFLIAINSALSRPSVTITATSGAGSVTAQLAVYSPIELVAITSGSGRSSLYWHGVSGAIGYNVYRSLTSGGTTTKINSTPVATLDPGPGLTNAYLYKDMGLTNGTEYFYYVVAVKSGNIEGVRSNEASTIPDPTAIPWDTGDAAQIIGAIAARDMIYREQDDPDPAEIAACGPNGVNYRYMRDNLPTPQAFAPEGYFDSEARIVFNSDGTVDPVTMDTVTDADPVPGQPFEGYPGSKGGPFRKVEAKKGQLGLRATVVLPAISAINLVEDKSPTRNTKNSTSEEAYIYTGGNISGIELDMGVQFVVHTLPGDFPPNKGWKPFARAKGNPLMKKPPVVRGELYLVPDTPARFTFFAPGYGGVGDDEVKMSYLGKFYNKSNGQYSIDRVVIIYELMGWKIKNVNTLTVKRVNSIAQPGAIDLLQGYRPNSSYVLGAAWGFDPLGNEGNVRLIPGGDWDTTLTRNQGSFPGRPLVNWISDNAFFIERNINLKTQP